MHNIYNVNRSVAGHYINFDTDTIDITKGDTSFSLKRREDCFSFHLDTLKSEATSNSLKCSVSGWAFANRNTSPAKSIYIAYNGKIIARANATRRIDVRAELDLTFDDCGFDVGFSLPKISQHFYTVTLILVDGVDSQIHHVRISNPQKADQVRTLLTSLDRTVTRPTEPSFEYRIESAKLIDGRLNISGWCFLKEAPNTEVYLNFVKSGIILGETTLQTTHRPDVGTTFDLNNSLSFFGFDYTSHQLNALPLSAHDRSIDMLLACGQTKKELIRIYSE